MFCPLGPIIVSANVILSRALKASGYAKADLCRSIILAAAALFSYMAIGMGGRVAGRGPGGGGICIVGYPPTSPTKYTRLRRLDFEIKVYFDPIDPIWTRQPGPL